MTALDDIQAERRRQIEVEGWTSEHDDAHPEGQLLQAAACYYLHTKGLCAYTIEGGRNGFTQIPKAWPWDPEWWKPKTPRHDLVRAGALCLAEKERHLRKHPGATIDAFDPFLDQVAAAIDAIDQGAAHG